jgi:uncharacterized membrane protein
VGAGSGGTGLDSNLAGALAYVLGWVTGLIFYVIEDDDQFVRFHALQSILLSVAFFGIYVALTIVSIVLGVIGLGFLLALLWPVVWLGGLAVWILSMYQAYNHRWYEFPVIGGIARQKTGSAGGPASGHGGGYQQGPQTGQATGTAPGGQHGQPQGGQPGQAQGGQGTHGGQQGQHGHGGQQGQGGQGGQGGQPR